MAATTRTTTVRRLAKGMTVVGQSGDRWRITSLSPEHPDAISGDRGRAYEVRHVTDKSRKLRGVWLSRSHVLVVE